METTIVLCGCLEDFQNWLFIHLGFQHRVPIRIIVVNNRRYIGVSQAEHMCSYTCDTISFTAAARGREDFEQLMISAQCCLAHKKNFKFGR